MSDDAAAQVSRERVGRAHRRGVVNSAHNCCRVPAPRCPTSCLTTPHDGQDGWTTRTRSVVAIGTAATDDSYLAQLSRQALPTTRAPEWPAGVSGLLPPVTVSSSHAPIGQV